MLEWIISSSVLAAALIAVRYVFKGRIRPLIQYAFWALLLIRLLVPFSLGSSFLSVNNLLYTSETAARGAVLPEPATYQNNLLFADNRKQEDANGVFGDPIVINSSGTAQAPMGFPEINQKAETSPWFTTPQQPGHEENSSTPYTAEGILLIIWAAGFLCVLAWFLFCNIKFTICLRKSRILLNPEITSCMDQMKKLNSGSRQLPVYLSRDVDTPCLFGLFHPAIYVTDEVTRNEVGLRHVMIHETVHFRHGDHIWPVLRGICISLHWFNPLVWWAGFLSRRDCELACDEVTLKILGENERSEYGKTLLSITCAHSMASMLTAATISGKKSAIYERIKMMTSKNNKSVISIIAALLIVVIAAGCTFTGAAENAIEESEKAPAVAETFVFENSMIPHAYDKETGKWITEDGHEYQYKYTLSGRMNNAAAETCFVVLSNRNNVTFEQCERHWISSNTADHFDAEETVIVDMYIKGTEPSPACELHIPLKKNGWMVVSAHVSDTLFSLTSCYPERLFEKDPVRNTCADLTSIRLQDGTIIDDFPSAVEWIFDTEQEQTIFTQSISLKQLQDYHPSLSQKPFSMKDITAVCIAEWDPVVNAFDYANEIEIVWKEDDIRTQFLNWRFTSNLNDRWEIYQDEINTIMAGITVPAQEEAPVGIVKPDQDIQEKLEAAAAGYYSEISEFTSAKLVQQMINNRTPMSDDSLYLEYGVKTEFVDVTFGEGKEDPFASGLVYDFDARIIVNGYELLPNYPYVPEEDGYFHMTGQITVDEGLITNIYVAKQS